MDIGATLSCAVHQGGTVTCRGSRRPPAVVHGLRDAVEVAARASEPCARTAAGEVWCWWHESADAPTRLDERTDAVQIADDQLTGRLFVLRRDGSVTRHPPGGPAQAVAGIVDATAVAAGHSFVCVLHADGGASCIDELLEDTPVVRAVPGPPDLVQLTVGGREACGVTGAGDVRCWQVSTVTRELLTWPVPKSVQAGRVAAGNGFACSLHRGSVACWGRTPWPTTGPTIVGLAEVDEIFAGPRQLCARTTTGSMWCLGSDQHGQIGDGRRHGQSGANHMVGLRALAAASDVTCAAVEDGALFCWGTAEAWTRPTHVGQFAGIAQLVASESAICVRDAEAVRCRGLPHVDKAGSLLLDASWRTLPASADAIDVDLHHTTACALRRDGLLTCWELDAESVQARQAGRVDDATALVLATEGRTVYVRTATGAVRCLGHANQCVPTASLQDVAAIAAGDRHLCTLTKSGVVRCASGDREGQLGGAPRRPMEPVTVEGRYRAIDAFGDQTCAITEPARAIVCWGAAQGQWWTEPRHIEGFAGAAAMITVGARHVCVGLEDGTVECRGANRSGELGNGRAAIVPRPRRLSWSAD